MLLEAKLPDLSKYEETRLTSNASSGDTTIYVQSTSGFSNNDYIILGKPQTENTECVQINAAVSSDTQLTVTALSYSHDVDDSVTYTKYNQVRFFRASSETGSYSAQTTKDIDWGQPKTYYDDTAGTSSDWLKIKYYNSNTSALSDFSDAIPYSGFGFTTVGDIIERARKKTNTINNYSLVSDESLIDELNELEDRLNRLSDWEEAQSSATDTSVASQQTYDLPTDYKIGSFFELRYKHSDSYYYPEYIPFHTFSEKYETDNEASIPTHFTIYDDQVYLYPIPSSAGDTMTFFYQKNPGDLSDVNDTVTFPWTDIYKNQLCSFIFILLQEKGLASTFNDRVETGITEVMTINRGTQDEEFGKVRRKKTSPDVSFGKEPDEITTT